MIYQRPAYEEVRIANGDSNVTLRPSLRAAATLEQRYGMPALFQAVDDLNLTIINDIILSSSPSGQDDAAAFLRSEAAGRPLSSFFLAVHQPLTELVAMFMLAPDPKAKPSAGKPAPWREVYAGLYDVATGWLGWTPEEAWNATPTEIDRAFTAHFAKLKSIHGSADDKDKSTKTAPDADLAERLNAEGLDPEFDRAALRALKAKIANG